jgi:hypothetical protein
MFVYNRIQPYDCDESGYNYPKYSLFGLSQFSLQPISVLHAKMKLRVYVHKFSRLTTSPSSSSVMPR